MPGPNFVQRVSRTVGMWFYHHEHLGFFLLMVVLACLIALFFGQCSSVPSTPA